MPDAETIELATENYRLRTLGPNDASERYVSWLDDLEINRYLEVRFSPQSIETVTDYIMQHDNRTGFLFGIFADEELHIGNIIVRLTPLHRLATLGVLIGDKDYWGRRVVLEVRAAVLDYCFDVLDVEKAEGGCYAGNRPAIYNYQRQGWELDGVRKRHLVSGDRRDDLVQFAMFKEQWQRLRSEA